KRSIPSLAPLEAAILEVACRSVRITLRRDAALADDFQCSDPLTTLRLARAACRRQGDPLWHISFTAEREVYRAERLDQWTTIRRAEPGAGTRRLIPRRIADYKKRTFKTCASG